jgi:short subunit dehydrogenase-like uncharacterized protein
MGKHLLIYGANGYTGTLIAQLAAAKRLKPILAGRDNEAVAGLAATLGFEHRAFALTDTAALEAGLEGVAAVLHCAGPFSQTAQPVVEACMRKKVHYLDITGEVSVFEANAARDEQARASGVMVLSGAGLDVTPTDCLAAHLKRRLPSATHLALALDAAPWVSRGTVKTLIESFHEGTVREAGRLVTEPIGHRSRTIDIGRGPVRAITVPWGDVSSAYRSTGIPNIEVYIATTAGVRAAFWIARQFSSVISSAPVQRALKAGAVFAQPGPTPAQRSSGAMLIWGEARDDMRVVTSRLRLPEGYTLTAYAALEMAERAQRGDAKPGYQTPSSAYGADFILTLPGCSRHDAADEPN